MAMILSLIARLTRLVRPPAGESLVPRPLFMMLLGFACAVLLASESEEGRDTLTGWADGGPAVVSSH